jgi:hypothetical protein
MPMPLSLSAALVCSAGIPNPGTEAVLVGPSEEVLEALNDSEALLSDSDAEIAEDSNELSMEPVTDAVPVAESAAVSVPVTDAAAEASASVEDISIIN